MGRPCEQCSGTDTARECAQCQCYAEQYRQEQAEEQWSREQEDWRRRIEEERDNA